MEVHMELFFNEVGCDYGIVATVEYPEDPAEREEFVAAMQAMVRELNAGLWALSKRPPHSVGVVLTLDA